MGRRRMGQTGGAKPIARIDRLSSWARMATFSTRFLGCKVSFADAQAIRERLLADGHQEVAQGGEIQVVNTCCVTHEAVSKSRQAASRAARSARTVYVTGCASRLEQAFDGAAANVVVTGRTGDDAAAFVAGDVGAIGCVNAEHRPRPGSRLREDPGRLLVLLCVLRDPARTWRDAEPNRGRGARRDPAPCRAGTPRDRPHGRQPRLLPRPCCRLHTRAPRARGRRAARARAAPALVDRGQSRRRRRWSTP